MSRNHDGERDKIRRSQRQHGQGSVLLFLDVSLG